MKTTKCITCSTEIHNSGYKKHSATCTGVYIPPFVKLINCPHCFIDLDSVLPVSNRANHVRWCVNNPKRAAYKNTNSGSQLNSPAAIKKRSALIKQAHADGKYDAAHAEMIGKPGTQHTVATKLLMREKALASPHRRLVRSIREYIKKDGTVVKLDSSWEEALAIRLDSVDINWTRPGPIKWIDVLGVTHNYFPDFYLIDYDIYLDPKNPYAIKAQQSKLDCLLEQIPNLVIIKSLDDCKNYHP